MKKILSIFISVILLVSGLCISVVADGVSQQSDTLTDGIFTYFVDNDKAIISSIDSTVAGELIIPATIGGYPVKEIINNSDLESVTSVKFSRGIEVIGMQVFSFCEALEKVELCDTIKVIDEGAFAYTGIKTITIPASVEEMYGAFWGCSELDTITVEEGNLKYKVIGGCLIDIDTKTLYSATNNCVIPDDGSVEIIEWGAFTGLKMETIVVPDGVTTICEGAFAGCHQLKTVVIPKSVVNFDGYIFGGYPIGTTKNVTVKCYENSTAHTYATENNIPVEFIVDKIEEAKPEIIEGKDASYKKDGKTELAIKSNADFIDFESVLVDGKEIDKNNYTVKEGSTVVTLKADYLNTLSVGKHTVGIKSKNGIAETTITITQTDTNTVTSPKTGDTTTISIVLLTMISIVVSALSIKKLGFNN